jgi:type I restriction enzyme M protein
VWIYDARTNVPGITKKDRPLTTAHFAEFEKCYGDGPERQVASGRPATRRTIVGAASTSPRWRSASSSSTAFKWLKEESLEDADDLPPPEELATDAIAELEEAVGELGVVLALLENGDEAKPKKKAARA